MAQDTMTPMAKRAGRSPLWLAGVLGGLGALVANEALLVFTKPLAPNLFSLSEGPVAFWTLLGALGATLVYGLVRWRSPRPERPFLVIAIVVLLVSFIPDLLLFKLPPNPIEQVTVGGVVALMAMHVVAALIITPALLLLARPVSAKA